MITLQRLLKGINPLALRTMGIRQPGDIIDAALFIYLAKRDDKFIKEIFWNQLTGGERRDDRWEKLACTQNLLWREFYESYCNSDGSVNWKKLPKLQPKSRTRKL